MEKHTEKIKNQEQSSTRGAIPEQADKDDKDTTNSRMNAGAYCASVARETGAILFQ